MTANNLPFLSLPVSDVAAGTEAVTVTVWTTVLIAYSRVLISYLTSTIIWR